MSNCCLFNLWRNRQLESKGDFLIVKMYFRFYTPPMDGSDGNRGGFQLEGRNVGVPNPPLVTPPFVGFRSASRWLPFGQPKAGRRPAEGRPSTGWRLAGDRPDVKQK